MWTKNHGKIHGFPRKVHPAKFHRRSLRPSRAGKAVLPRGPQRSRPKGRQATCESAPCHLPPVVRPGKLVPGVVGQRSRTVRDMNSGMGCQCFGGISMDGDITISRPSIVHRYQQRDTLAESNLTMDNPVPKIIAWFDGGVLRRASHWPPTEKWRRFSRFRWWIHQWESLLIWVE